jgi:hypothetical protein
VTLISTQFPFVVPRPCKFARPLLFVDQRINARRILGPILQGWANFGSLPQGRANLRDLILAQTSCAIGSDSPAFPRVRKFAHPFMPSDRRRIRKTGVPKNKHLPSSPPAGILAIVLFAKHGFNTFLAADLFSCSLRMLQKGSVALRTIPVYSDLAFLW